jgi:hypothetical protein
MYGLLGQLGNCHLRGKILPSTRSWDAEINNVSRVFMQNWANGDKPNAPLAIAVIRFTFLESFIDIGAEYTAFHVFD